jgi:beta-glucanase (GH16 family)
MRRILCSLGLSVVLILIAHGPLVNAQAKPGWKLAWSDEFDGKDIDRTKWDFDLGNGFYNYEAKQWIAGWGNGELQYYTREPDNAFVKDGMLHIRALKESLHGFGYSSAKLKTKKRDGSMLFATKYGKIEFRAKLPTGKGIWPAVWMLPQEEKHGGWAASGEIDILEVKGHEPNQVLGTLHFGSRWPANTNISKTYTLPDKGTVADFHVYTLEWTPGEFEWAVDGKTYATQNFWWSSSKSDGKKGAKPAKETDLNPWPAPFDQPFYLIINLAVGGQFPGSPDKTTPFPAEMLIDFVRVYEKVGGYGEPKKRGEGKLPF